MKKLSTLLSSITALAMATWLTGCTTATSNSAAIDSSQTEMRLRQSGFITRTVTTPTQTAAVEKLPPAVVSAVKYKGKLYYVYPTGKKDQVFIGRQKEFDTFKKADQAAAVARAQSQGQQNVPAGAYLTGETAGPNRIQVDTFDGFGPLQNSPEWQ